MTGLKLIAYISVAATALIIIIDINLLIQHGAKATLSYWMLTEGHKEPILACIFGIIVGILFGHFWWSQ